MVKLNEPKLWYYRGYSLQRSEIGGIDTIASTPTKLEDALEWKQRQPPRGYIGQAWALLAFGRLHVGGIVTEQESRYHPWRGWVDTIGPTAKGIHGVWKLEDIKRQIFSLAVETIEGDLSPHLWSTHETWEKRTGTVRESVQ